MLKKLRQRWILLLYLFIKIIPRLLFHSGFGFYWRNWFIKAVVFQKNLGNDEMKSIANGCCWTIWNSGKASFNSLFMFSFQFINNSCLFMNSLIMTLGYVDLLWWIFSMFLIFEHWWLFSIWKSWNLWSKKKFKIWTFLRFDSWMIFTSNVWLRTIKKAF